MKKVAYIALGTLLGIIISTTGGAFADAVKSMVGKTVTGEYSIVVNGKTLSDKGAVIDSRANVPARALSEALGADVKVSGKTITITSDEGTALDNTEVPTLPAVSNKYMGQSKTSLEDAKRIIQEKSLAPTKTGREEVAKWLEESKEQGNQIAVDGWTKQLKQYDDEIAKYEAEIKLIEAALAAIK